MVPLFWKLNNALSCTVEAYEEHQYSSKGIGGVMVMCGAMVTGPVLDVGTVIVPFIVDPFLYVGAVPDAGRLVVVAG